MSTRRFATPNNQQFQAASDKDGSKATLSKLVANVGKSHERHTTVKQTVQKITALTKPVRDLVRCVAHVKGSVY